MLKVGDLAPDFSLKDKSGCDISLSSLKGGRVVVYFYAKDNTPGCTRQACAFASRLGEFKERGVTVIGISRDSVLSHEKFSQKYGLDFLLLSDPSLEVIKAYGVWGEKKMCGKVGYGVLRTTFVIDEDGYISHVFEKVKPDTNAEEILAVL